MDLSKCSYLGEGGRHVVFAVEDASHSKVLRIAKEKMMDVVAGMSLKRLDGTIATSSKDDYNMSIEFINSILKPTLGSYVDVPAKISLEATAVNQLYAIAQQSGKIPPGRLQDWTPNAVHAERMSIENVVPAQVLPDYRTFPLGTDTTPCVTAVEIKPKAGYMAASPLVRADLRCKYLYTRYRMMSRLRSGHAVDDNNDLDEYDPRLLFTGTYDDIWTALDSLLVLPRNNLRIWQNQLSVLKCDSVDAMGESRPTAERRFDEILLGATVAHPRTNAPSIVLKHVLATILASEPILSKVLILQNLDWIDADGAVLIYDRFVQLCDGSHHRAEQMLDDWSITNSDDATETDDVPWSPFPWPKPASPALHHYMQVLHECRAALSGSRPTDLPLPHADLDVLRQHALQCVHIMNIDDCMFLLRNWLLSLVMCDVSVFVTLMPPTAPGGVFEGDKILLPSSTRVVRQSETKPGTCYFKINDHWHEMRYQIKLVDCDPKPAAKLRTRRRKEDDWCQLKRSGHR